MLKVSAFYLEKQKSFIPKKNIFHAVVNIKTKKLCLLTQFSATVLFFSCFFSFYTPIPPGDLEIGQIAKNQKISQPGQNTIKMYFEKFLSGD